jgi:hypothetical protein
MSEAKCADSFFHPVSHYDSPDGVLNDPELSTDEKRVILSSWASDMYVVESHPALREIPGIPHRLRLDDILAALKQLDDANDPPPRGGMAMRVPRFNRLDCGCFDKPQPSIEGRAATIPYRSTQPSRPHGHPRWTREAECEAISQASQHTADWHFLRRRARRAGFTVVFVGNCGDRHELSHAIAGRAQSV